MPAERSTTTSCPARASSRTPSGVAATRNSLSLTSLGIPTITGGSSSERLPGSLPDGTDLLPSVRQQQRERRLHVADAPAASRDDHLMERGAQQFDAVPRPGFGSLVHLR